MNSLRRHWLPLLSFVAVTLVAWLPISWNPTIILIGFLLSQPFYMAYIGVSVALLVLPFTRLFPSVQGDLKQIGWWVLDIMLCTLIISHGMKFLLFLPRPSGSPSGALSGHTAFGFGLAWLIAKVYPRLAPFWFASVVAIGWSRVQTEAHYPYQVPLGALLGLALGWAVTTVADGVLFPRCLKYKRGRRSQQPEVVESERNEDITKYITT